MTVGVDEVVLGDCLEVMREIPDGSVDMVLCDLPYGATDNSWDSVIPLESLWAQYRRIVKDTGAIALTAQTPFNIVLASSNLAWFRYEWIWRKNHGAGFLNAKKRPLRCHENVLIFYRRPPTYHPQMRPGAPYQRPSAAQDRNYGRLPSVVTINDGGRYPLSVLDFPEVPQSVRPRHPTQKPVALFAYLIRTYTNPGDVVLDNCIGSGTTAVACIQEGRHFIGIERDPTYHAIARTRVAEAQAAQQARLFADADADGNGEALRRGA